jgi:hypothetical protein
MRAFRQLVRATWMGVLAVGLISGTAHAGELSGHPFAFNDGNGPGANGAWTYSSAFDDGAGLSGYVDWTVFSPVHFPFADYTPAAYQLTYAFQIFSTGPDAIHSFSIPDPNGAALDIGTFTDLGGQPPISVVLGTQAEWNFSGLDAGQRSTGLAFSSNRFPASLFGVVVNGGSFAIAIPLPFPESINLTPIPYFPGFTFTPGTIPAFTGIRSFETYEFGEYVYTQVGYTVFAPGDFDVAFPGQDPSGGADYVYAYKIGNWNPYDFSSVSPDVSKFTVGLDGDEPLGTIGFIGGEGVDPSASLFVGTGPTSAAWDFDPGQLTDGAESAILFFTSPNPPEWDTATVTAAGASTHNLPSPVPEPASLGLLAVAAVTGMGRRYHL